MLTNLRRKVFIDLALPNSVPVSQSHRRIGVMPSKLARRIQDRETSSLAKQGTLESHATKPVPRGPAASASLGSLLEMLSLGPHPDPLIQKPNQLPRG